MNSLNLYDIKYICEYLSLNEVLNLSLTNKKNFINVYSIYKIKKLNIGNKNKLVRIDKYYELYLNLKIFTNIYSIIHNNISSVSFNNVNLFSNIECIKYLYNLKKLILNTVTINDNIILPDSLHTFIIINCKNTNLSFIKNLNQLKSLGITINDNNNLVVPPFLKSLSIISSNFIEIDISNIVNICNVHLINNKKLKKINLPNESYVTIISCDKLKTINTNNYSFIYTCNNKNNNMNKNIESYHEYLLNN